MAGRRGAIQLDTPPLLGEPSKKGWGWLGIGLFSVLLIGGAVVVLILWATGVFKPKPEMSSPPPSPQPITSRLVGIAEPLGAVPTPGDAELRLRTDGSYYITKSPTLQESVSNPDYKQYFCEINPIKPLNVGDKIASQKCYTLSSTTSIVIPSSLPLVNFIVKSLV